VAYGYGKGYGSDALLPRIVGRILQPAQKQQIHSLLAADKSNLKNLRAQVHAAQEKLNDDLLAGNDISSDLQQLETAQNQLLAERVSLEQKIVANLSPTQRQQISQFRTQWRSLHEQQQQLLQQFGGS
jgi:Spy/CpxP family protein refolding chaperone